MEHNVHTINNAVISVNLKFIVVYSIGVTFWPIVFLILPRQSSNKLDLVLDSFVGFIEFTLRKALEEIAAGVFEYTGLNDEHTRDICLYYFH